MYTSHVVDDSLASEILILANDPIKRKREKIKNLIATTITALAGASAVAAD